MGFREASRRREMVVPGGAAGVVRCGAERIAVVVRGWYGV